MDKGSGTQQAKTVNPTGAAQLPYLTGGWGKASDLYQANSTQLAPAPAGLTQGYQDFANTGASVDQTLRPTINESFTKALTGGYGVENSPAYAALNSLSAGTTAPQTAASGYGATAASATGPGYDQLAKSARGDYLNSNPYLDKAITAAQDPTARTYQTVTDPTTRGNFSTAGRYGSPALEGAGGARSTNELNLGKTLGDIATNLSFKDYSAERTLQDTAAKDYATARNYGLGLGIQGSEADLKGREYGAGALQSGYQAGNTAALQALSDAPAVTKLQFTAPQAAIDAGLGERGLAQQEIDAPYKALDRYLTEIGQPSSAGTSTPYYQNQTSNTLSALTGAAGLGKDLLGTSSGGLLGGLFGSGAGGAAAATALPDLTAIALPGASAFGSSLAAAAPAAAWIICTELKRQGRMPVKHWAVGVKVFDAYPEVFKRGYYVWAIPSVRHLRRRPDSLYSKLLGTVFRWRAENIAASASVRGARRLWRGRAVTVALTPVCLVLGLLCGPQDWSAVYREEAVR